MGVFKRTPAASPGEISPSSTAPPTDIEKDGEAIHAETATTNDPPQKWKLSKSGDGDVAMALFASPNELHEPIDPAEERALKRKVDWMILRAYTPKRPPPLFLLTSD